MDIRAPMWDSKSEYIKGDIRNRVEVEKAMSKYPFDAIISLAAEHKDFGLSREDYFKTNEYGTKVLCDAATEIGIKKIVFYSSVAVYGNNQEPSTEKTPPDPNHPYGESKLAGEKILLNWAQADSSRCVLIIRPTVVYGERNIANMFRLVDQISKGRYFHIGKGDNIKSIAYVKNIVDATLFLMGKMKPGVEIYNYSDDPQLSVKEIAEVITETLSKKIQLSLPYSLAYLMAIPFDIFIKISGKDLPVSSNRIKKLCTETYHKADKLNQSGFKRKYSNREGLKNMVWWKNNEYEKETVIFNV